MKSTCNKYQLLIAFPGGLHLALIYFYTDEDRN
jgi:hypothetical protein